jgi:hypothetical protein
LKERKVEDFTVAEDPDTTLLADSLGHLPERFRVGRSREAVAKANGAMRCTEKT